MSDKSRRPFHTANKISLDAEKKIIEARQKEPAIGAVKTRKMLITQEWDSAPSVSTFNAVFKRNGLITKQASEKAQHIIRFQKEQPNEMWQMDYKGNFGLCNGSRCFPLTILDDCSRFSICIEAKDNERWLPAKDCLQRVFKEYGLPKSILCDNGNPWGSCGVGYTLFDVWMMQMNILPIHGRILHPQTQGKDERFHRTMKEDVLKRTLLRNLEHAQNEFDKFRYCYNYERPHESLGLDVPAKHYKKSKRRYMETPKEPEYDTGKQLRKVNFKGYISVDQHRYYLSESLIDKYIEIIPIDEQTLNLCYGQFSIARIDTAEKIVVSKKIYRR